MYRYCSKCRKSLKACICDWIKTLSTSVELIILQHSKEENRPMGTARILSLSLPNSRLIVGEDFSDNVELNGLLSESEVEHVILYPSEKSTDIQAFKQVQDPDRRFGDEKRLRVILLDGTWKKAFKMWQVSNNLRDLTCIHLPTDLQGNYRIRKAPSSNSLSTVEAGYHILSLLEPENDFSPLLEAFDNMIEFQIKQMPPGVFEKNYLSKLSD